MANRYCRPSSLWRYCLGACLAASLSACGWQLRGLETSPTGHITFGSSDYPRAIRVVSYQKYSPFVAELIEAMRIFEIEGSDTAEIELLVLDEQLQKRTVAVTSIGSAAQYELELTITYHYKATSDKSTAIEAAKKIQAQRTFDFEPGNNIAKNEEENTLLKEMRQEIATRVLRHSRKIKSGSL